MIRIVVTESSQVAEARRRAAEIAEADGFSETDAGRVALVATELATNLIKHGGGRDLAGFTRPTHGIELLRSDMGRHGAPTGRSPTAIQRRDAGHCSARLRQSHFVDIGSCLSGHGRAGSWGCRPSCNGQPSGGLRSVTLRRPARSLRLTLERPPEAQVCASLRGRLCHGQRERGGAGRAAVSRPSGHVSPPL